MKAFSSRIIVNTKEAAKTIPSRPRTYKQTYSSKCGKKENEKNVEKEPDKNNNGDKNKIKTVPG